jgi:hypothetical protein
MYIYCAQKRSFGTAFIYPFSHTIYQNERNQKFSRHLSTNLVSLLIFEIFQIALINFWYIQTVERFLRHVVKGNHSNLFTYKQHEDMPVHFNFKLGLFIFTRQLLVFSLFCVSSKLWNLSASQGIKQTSFKSKVVFACCMDVKQFKKLSTSFINKGNTQERA